MIQCACHVSDTTFSLVFENLAESFHEAATDLAFSREGNNFSRTFSVQGNDVSTICQNFQRHGRLLLLQTARVQHVPWKKALHLWLERLSHQPIYWWLGGSAALAVRGIDVEPRDFDIITDDVGAEQLGTLFHDVLIEPVVPVQGWMCNWFGRAFLEARFEWVGGWC